MQRLRRLQPAPRDALEGDAGPGCGREGGWKGLAKRFTAVTVGCRGQLGKRGGGVRGLGTEGTEAKFWLSASNITADRYREGEVEWQAGTPPPDPAPHPHQHILSQAKHETYLRA